MELVEKEKQTLTESTVGVRGWIFISTPQMLHGAETCEG
jgi:hypothetical protein